MIIQRIANFKNLILIFFTESENLLMAWLYKMSSSFFLYMKYFIYGCMKS